MKEFYITLDADAFEHLTLQRMLKILKRFKFKLQNWGNNYEYEIEQSNQ